MVEIKSKKSYSFLTETISYSSLINEKGKKHYVTGYISVPEIDLYNDLVTPNAMKSMLRQIQQSTIMLDYEHEVWRDNPTIIPVGKIVEAKIDDRGLWVKAVLNPSSPKFKDLWGSVKEGFIKAFSIAFKPIKTITKDMGDMKVRLIEDLELLNVALTGVPVNQGAVMTEFGMKAVMMKAIVDSQNNQEVEIKMVEENKKPDQKDNGMSDEEKKGYKKGYKAGLEEAKKEEAKDLQNPKEYTDKKDSEEKKEEKDEKEEKMPPKPEEKGLSEALAQLKSMADKLDAMEKQNTELKSVLEKDVFKSSTPEPIEQKSKQVASVLGLIR